ncbi:hypothetical protein OROMI_013317 [Orobanche minor]
MISSWQKICSDATRAFGVQTDLALIGHRSPSPDTPAHEFGIYSDLDFFTEVANKAADAAGEIVRQAFRKKLKVDDKGGDGPVTQADKEAEDAMVSVISQNLPSHAIFGEETGWTWNDKSTLDYVWVLDPVDGTTNFIAGKCSFGILVSLLYKSKPILGIIDQPILQDRWVGVVGRRTIKNGVEVSTRPCQDIRQAYMDIKSPNCNDDARFAYDRTIYKVNEAFFNGNCIAYGELASGFIDLIIDCALDPFDFLALIPVVEGAGGVITDWNGCEILWEASPRSSSIPEGGFKVVASGDKQSHDKVLEELSSL